MTPRSRSQAFALGTMTVLATAILLYTSLASAAVIDRWMATVIAL